MLASELTVSVGVGDEGVRRGDSGGDTGADAVALPSLLMLLMLEDDDNDDAAVAGDDGAAGSLPIAFKVILVISSGNKLSNKPSVPTIMTSPSSTGKK